MIDRELQLSILKKLRERYPDGLDIREIPEHSIEPKFLTMNLFYLNEHDLVKAVDGNRDIPSGDFRATHGIVRITSKGLDFLEDDGGLSAILGKVVIKFDEADLFQLLKAIDNAPGTPEQKINVKKMLESISADSLKTAYMRILNYGLNKVPNVLSKLEEMLKDLV